MMIVQLTHYHDLSSDVLIRYGNPVKRVYKELDDENFESLKEWCGEHMIAVDNTDWQSDLFTTSNVSIIAYILLKWNFHD